METYFSHPKILIFAAMNKAAFIFFSKSEKLIDHLSAFTHILRSPFVIVKIAFSMKNMMNRYKLENEFQFPPVMFFSNFGIINLRGKTWRQISLKHCYLKKEKPTGKP